MRLFLAAVLLFVLAACSQPPMRGIIIKKNYRPSWTQHYVVFINDMPVHQQIVHPAQWDIVIQADGTGDDEGQHLVVVSQEYWEAVEVGDIWERSVVSHPSEVEKP